MIDHPTDLFGFRAVPPRTRTDQIIDAFQAFHRANPEVWALFQRFALEAARSGRTNYSANAIFERIRWHVEIETNGDDIKLNNNYRAHYARMFHLAHPRHDGFFRNRRLASADSDEAETDMQVFNVGPPENEDAIMDRLREILMQS